MSDGDPQQNVSSLFAASGRTMAEVTRAWTNASTQVLKNITEANQAVLSAFGGGDISGEVTESSDVSIGYSRRGWSLDRDLTCDTEVTVGDTLRFSKVISEANVDAFADATGDTNRLHLDEAFASNSRFGEPIAHGILVLGLISAALARLPGLTIYLSQDIQFIRPATIGQRYTAVIEVVEQLGDKQFRLTTDVVDESGEMIVDGEAVVLVDDLPA
ncbi:MULTISPECIES: MaoC family dehydratase [Haloferax]|nr:MULTISPECIES: MaoC family dehydratase [Haloferax]